MKPESDLDRLTREATTKAVLAVGRDAAKRATDKLLSDEDVPGSEDKAASKPRRWKLVALVVLGLSLIIGLVGLLLNYWLYFLAAGVLGVGGLVGWSRLKKRMGAKKSPKDRKDIEAGDSPRHESVRVHLAPGAATTPPTGAATRAEADAQTEARAAREHEVDEELAAMKARLKR